MMQLTAPAPRQAPAIAGSPIRLIVGAGNTQQNGWLAAQFADLDIRDEGSWAKSFRPGTIDNVLSEHVLEHLELAEAYAAASNIQRYLKCGGVWRIAVPDGFHPSPAYLNWVAPGSPGETFLNSFRPADEPPHKFLWCYRTLVQFLTQNGFKVILREWFDQRGEFHQSDWGDEAGHVWRRAGTGWSGLLSVLVGAPYTSLVVDAVKVCR